MIGQTLSHYRIVGEVGAGGMGVVYRAEDLRLGRNVALKLLPEGLAREPQALERLRREARAASALNHPGICTIHDIDAHEGRPFIVMELLEGMTLQERIGGKPLGVQEILDLGIQIADALEAAHGQGITHRDVKPANIFVTARGRAKLLDFGLAKQASRGVAAGSEITMTRGEDLTAPGAAVGTIAYMSPEQARGEEVDRRTDLFSFGVVLYEMATGVQPFRGPTAAGLSDAILHKAPTPPLRLNDELPPALEAVILRALEKDREVRYQTSSDLKAELKRLQRDLEPGRVPGDRHPAATSTKRRFGFHAIRVGAIAAVLVVAALGIDQLLGRRPVPRRELRQKRLTANPSANAVTATAISPDGRHIAYSDQGGVFLGLVESGETQKLPAPEDLVAAELTWLPDGTKILAAGVQIGRPPSIWLLSPLGGAPRKFVDGALSPAPSPTGAEIAYLGDLDSGEARGLWLVVAAGEPARRLLASRAGEVLLRARWSPDGRRIAYLRSYLASEGRESAVESVDLNGGPPTLVLSDSKLQDFVWSPDGRVLYSLNEQAMFGSNSNLWQVDLDRRTGRPVGKPARVADWADFSFSDLSLSADGKRLAFLKRTAQSDVYVGDLEANGTRLRSLRRLTPNESNDWPAGWSLDGKAVVFWSDRNGRWDNYKQGVDQESADLMPGGREPKWYSRFSPDGSWFLYLALPRPEPPTGTLPVRIMRVPAAGGLPQLVLSATGTSNIHCSRAPAGLCVYDAQDHDQRVWTAFDPAHGKLRELARIDSDPGATPGWDLSPDGTRLAIVDRHSTRMRLLSLTGAASTDLTPKGWGGLFEVDWAPDGRSLYASSITAGRSAVLRLDLKGEAVPLWQQDAYVITCARPSPDGRRLAIALWTTDSNVWMMEDF